MVEKTRRRRLSLKHHRPKSLRTKGTLISGSSWPPPRPILVKDSTIYSSPIPIPRRARYRAVGSPGVSWQTMTPSSEDTRGFHPRQTVSIICHRDPANNRTPVAFVNSRSGQVLARHRGTSAFQGAADDVMRRERSARTLGRRVGRYARR